MFRISKTWWVLFKISFSDLSININIIAVIYTVKKIVATKDRNLTCLNIC